MCLQWCYVKQWILNNDVPCHQCPLAQRPDPTRQCVACIHRRVRWVLAITHPESHPVSQVTVTVHAPDTGTVPATTRIVSVNPTMTTVHVAWNGTSHPQLVYTVRIEPWQSEWIGDPPPSDTTCAAWTVPWDTGAICSVTHAPIPGPHHDRGCCHANAIIADRHIPIADVRIAPWEPYPDAAAMFRAWDEEPPSIVKTARFTRPVIFGVPSSQWHTPSTSGDGLVPPSWFPRLITLLETICAFPGPPRDTVREEYHDLLALIRRLRADGVFHGGDADTIWTILTWMELIDDPPSHRGE